jgi:RNA polymerase sigma-70 factor (ECF subfamily)
MHTDTAHEPEREMINCPVPVQQKYSDCSLEQLVDLCKNRNNSEAWEELIFRTHRLIAAAVRSTLIRWGSMESSSVDDLVQEVYLKISANRGAGFWSFESRHPGAILGYLRATAVSVTHDYFKSLMAAKRGAGVRSEGMDHVTALAQSAEASPDVIEKQVLLRQIDDFLSGQPVRDRVIFWLYYRQGLTASSIASVPWVKLTAKGVESAIMRITRAVRERLARPESMIAVAQKDAPPPNSL